MTKETETQSAKEESIVDHNPVLDATIEQLKDTKLKSLVLLGEKESGEPFMSVHMMDAGTVYILMDLLKQDLRQYMTGGLNAERTSLN